MRGEILRRTWGSRWQNGAKEYGKVWKFAGSIVQKRYSLRFRNLSSSIRAKLQIRVSGYASTDNGRIVRGHAGCRNITQGRV